MTNLRSMLSISSLILLFSSSILATSSTWWSDWSTINYCFPLSFNLKKKDMQLSEHIQPHSHIHLLSFESLQPWNFFILLLPTAAGIVSVLQSSSPLFKSNLIKDIQYCPKNSCRCQFTASSFDTFRSLSILFSSLMSMSIRSRSSMIREASASGLSSSSNGWLAAILFITSLKHCF